MSRIRRSLSSRLRNSSSLYQALEVYQHWIRAIGQFCESDVWKPPVQRTQDCIFIDIFPFWLRELASPSLCPVTELLVPSRFPTLFLNAVSTFRDETPNLEWFLSFGTPPSLLPALKTPDPVNPFTIIVSSSLTIPLMYLLKESLWGPILLWVSSCSMVPSKGMERQELVWVVVSPNPEFNLCSMVEIAAQQVCAIKLSEMFYTEPVVSHDWKDHGRYFV